MFQHVDIATFEVEPEQRLAKAVLYRRPIHGVVVTGQHLQGGAEGVGGLAEDLVVAGSFGDGLQDGAQVLLDQGPFKRGFLFGQDGQAFLVGFHRPAIEAHLAALDGDRRQGIGVARADQPPLAAGHVAGHVVQCRPDAVEGQRQLAG